MTHRNRRKIHAAALLVVAILFASCRAKPLWKSTDRGRDRRWHGRVLHNRVQPVIVDTTALVSEDEVRLDLFGTEEIATRSSEAPSQRVDRDSFVGSLKNDPGSSVLIASEGDAVSGTIVRSDGSIFSVQPIGDGLSAVAQLPPLTAATKDAMPLSAPPALPRPEALLETMALREQPCVGQGNAPIDVAFLYTRAAEIGAADAGGITAVLKQLVLQADTAFLMSGVPRSVNRLGQDRTDFAEKATLEEDLRLLQSPGNPLFDDARKMRDRTGADVVVLIVEKGDVPGLSFVMEKVDQSFAPFAFMVVRREDAAGYFTFTHELGHLLGARHDWDTDPTDHKPDDHNHGFAQTIQAPPPASTYLTVMAAAQACAPGLRCVRLLRWSDPKRDVEVDHHHIVLGVLKPKPTNDRETVDRAAATVARFRCRQ